ncbi:hypothetical protein [Flavobacterium psychrotrophum]|uniref:hypothetical protein n=1 Tax=Flavobacterium psychrotrophum TaxID=2294119 RepID=UPI000E31BEA7|nr:hypothetical protein [Flavobacterium psychrotrophum]
MDYSILENDFDCACNDVVETLSKQYKSGYSGGGPGKLEAFLDLIKTSFEKAEAVFIESAKIAGDPEALRRIRQIARKHAKKCLESYGKIA